MCGTKSAFVDWDFGYNDLNELTSGDRLGQDDVPLVPGLYDYRYDTIGNRTRSNVDDRQNQNPMTYLPNSVNQYTETTGPGESFSYDSDGNLTADGKLHDFKITQVLRAFQGLING